MAIITTYPVDTASSQDYLLGTKKSNTGTQINPTKNFTVESVVNSVFQSLPAYADNAAAVAGGLAAGKLFQKKILYFIKKLFKKNKSYLYKSSYAIGQSNLIK